ncbi:hypothetical protein ZONE111905_20360 [Zobellia nedashkovskayae]
MNNNEEAEQLYFEYLKTYSNEEGSVLYLNEEDERGLKHYQTIHNLK